MIRLIIIFLLLVISGLQYQKANRLQAAEMGYIKIMHNRQVEIESLCEAVNNQEYIIRRNLPMVKMSWTAGLRAVCGQ